MAPQMPVVAATLILAGQFIVGGSLSIIVTVKLHVDLFPAASVVSKVFVVTPTGNNDPEANPVVLTVLAPAQLSVPIGAVYETRAPHCPAVMFCETLAGQLMTGV